MKLHGLAVSNYYNIAKLALLEKQLEFEEIHSPPSKEAEFLIHSPMGKVPYLQHEDFFVSESQAILFYLELFQPHPRLYPHDPKIAARAQQIHQFVDLYVDPPARSLLAAAFFSAPVTEEAISAVAADLKNNVRALSQIVQFSPYIAGPELSHADLAAVMTFRFCQSVMERLQGPDPLTALPGVGAYLQMMSERPSCRKAFADQQSALEKLDRR